MSTEQHVEGAAAVAEPKGLLRRMYHWVLSWAQSPRAELYLFLLAFAESSFFPIPPDVLLIALALSVPTRAFRYALTCTIGSVIGGAAGYAIGVFLFESVGRPIINFYHFQQTFDSLRILYGQYGFWIVFTAGFTPIPYKVFTIASGVFGIDFWQFIIASAIGRAGRFFLVAALIWKFGDKIRTFIDKYLGWLTIIFTVLLIGSFLLIKLLV
jgi:membrane protein YqaA with SNARE-associated domain